MRGGSQRQPVLITPSSLVVSELEGSREGIRRPEGLRLASRAHCPILVSSNPKQVPLSGLRREKKGDSCFENQMWSPNSPLALVKPVKATGPELGDPHLFPPTQLRGKKGFLGGTASPAALKSPHRFPCRCHGLHHRTHWVPLACCSSPQDPSPLHQPHQSCHRSGGLRAHRESGR